VAIHNAMPFEAGMQLHIFDFVLICFYRSHCLLLSFAALTSKKISKHSHLILRHHIWERYLGQSSAPCMFVSDFRQTAAIQQNCNIKVTMVENSVKITDFPTL